MKLDEYEKVLIGFAKDVIAYLMKSGVTKDQAEDVKAHLASGGKVGKATFGGVILTGKAENFAQLENQDWIFASSIGAAIPNQPYYQLDVE